MKTHYQAWASERVTACGRLDQRLTRDPAKVTCRRCRTSHRYRDAVEDEIPAMPVETPVRIAVRRCLRYRPATAKDIAKTVNRTDRRVRTILNELGAIKFRSPIDRNIWLWRAPDGGFKCR